MPMLKTAQWLFRPPNAAGATSTPEEGRLEQPSTPPLQRLKAPRGVERPKRSKRKWSAPLRVEGFEDKLREAGKKTCCARIGCLSRFKSGKDTLYNPGLLESEQDRMATFECEADRKRFVKERAPLVPLSVGTMYAANSQVCTFAFTTLFGVSKSLIDAAKSVPGALASSEIWRTPIATRPAHGKREAILGFLREWGRAYGQHMPHKDDIYLYMHDKKKLYGDFCDQLKRVYGKDGNALAAAKSTYDYFIKVWSKYMPSLKLKPRGDFMKCGVCTTLKEQLHGQAGCRGLQDSASRAKVTEEYKAHVEEISADRQVIADTTGAALRAKADGRPQDLVYMSADAANQSVFAIPMLYPSTHGGDKGWAERQKIYGVLVEGQSMNIFFTPQILGTGANLVCTAIYLQLMELVEAFGEPLKDVFIQVDNTVSENKNNILMAFLALMVARGVMETVTVLFMAVGHTHIKIDQSFSCFAKAAKWRTIFTRKLLARILKGAYKELPVQCTTLQNLANFKGLVADATRRIPSITKFRAFRIQMEGPAVVVEVKKAMHHPHWCGFSVDGKEVGVGDGFKPHRLLYAGAVRIEGTPAYHLKEVDPHTIRMVKQRQEASHSRLPAAFPGDEARQAEVKQHHAEGITLLEQKGFRDFDLPTEWLPEDKFAGNDEGLCAGDDSDGGSAESTLESDSDHDSSDEEEEGEGLAGTQQAAARKRRMDKETEGGRGVEDVGVGRFAFFVATDAPFLVGKVEGERVGEEGEREVCLHWYTPSKSLLQQAATIDIDLYGKAVFNAAYKVEDVAHASAGRARAKKRHVKDASWEPASRITASCRKLNGRGKRIPAAVLKALREAS